MSRLGNGMGRILKRPEHIELSEKHIPLRIAATVIFLMIGVTALVNGFYVLFSGTAGWQEIESTDKSYGFSGELTFYYDIGSSGVSAATEKKSIANLYSSAVTEAFSAFYVGSEEMDTVGVQYINSHPNEEIEVDEFLYEAFEKILSCGRYLYLAPIYTDYQGLFLSNYDWEAVEFDPISNETEAEYIAIVLGYASSDESVKLKLLDDNKVILSVSDEYMRFAEEMGISSYIDFGWLKNAFIVDYISDILIDAGYQKGIIASYNGFTRNLGGIDGYSYYTLYSRQGDTLYSAADMVYSGGTAIVYLRDYAISNEDVADYYIYENGDRRFYYINPDDGICKAAMSEMYFYSHDLGCADLALMAAEVYIDDSVDPSDLSELSDGGAESVYFDGYAIESTDNELILLNIADGFSIG